MYIYLISLFTSASLILKPQPQHRTKSTLSGKSAQSQIKNVVVKIVIACYSENQIISKPWTWNPLLLDVLPNLDQGNLLQPSSASTRESENCLPGLSFPWIICCNSLSSQLCFCDAAQYFDQRPPSGTQCHSSDT